MKKIQLFALLAAGFFLIFPVHAGERTIPVDIFLMIDKSLSMAEPGKFESLQKWVQENLLGQILITDDWITIYQFYGKTDHLLTATIKTEEDRQKITSTIARIEPDGEYTDIGLALDTLKDALAKREPNDRLKILYLLTDLKQEAPWTSRYAGTADAFESPYLAEARQLKHDNWYEITLDMDIQNSVVKTSRELYASILQLDESGGTRVLPADESELIDVTDQGSGTDENGAAGTNAPSTVKTTAGSRATGQNFAERGSLPFIALLVLLSVIFIVCLLLVPAMIRNRRKKKEQSE